MSMRKMVRLTMLFALGIATAIPATAQVKAIDPNSANADLAPVPASESTYGTTIPATPAQPAPASAAAPAAASAQPETAAAVNSATAATAESNATYRKDDLIAAAEGVFGKGAEGLAKMMETILKDQGEPNAYVAGREAGGAIAIGLRYGSGTLFHKVEGNMPIYWTGPSLGFDLGANGSKTFMLVYNLYNSADLYRRFPGGEGVVYVVGGFNASYHRRGDLVVIPIRLGVGWRLGANVGYMKFTRKSTVIPF